jgi:hypothetical protein
MRWRQIVLFGIVSASIALPTVTAPDVADARPRIFGIFGALLGGGIGFHHHFRHHRQGETHREAAAPVREVAPPVETRGIDDDTFGYVFWPTGYDANFWAHGELDVIEAMFAGGAPDASTICRQPGADLAKMISDRLAETVQASGDAAAALDVLHSKLTDSFGGIAATCRKVAPITAGERLKVLRERLAATRDAALAMRKALASFYETLSDEQKARLAPPAAPTRVSGPSAQASRDVELCHATQEDNWPSTTIEERVQPNSQQAASLEALHKAVANVATSLDAACPKEVEATPVARLDSATQRLDALLAATNPVVSALDDVDRELSDEQKARFNSIVV